MSCVAAQCQKGHWLLQLPQNDAVCIPYCVNVRCQTLIISSVSTCNHLAVSKIISTQEQTKLFKSWNYFTSPGTLAHAMSIMICSTHSRTASTHSAQHLLCKSTIQYFFPELPYLCVFSHLSLQNYDHYQLGCWRRPMIWQPWTAQAVLHCMYYMR